MKDIRSLKKYRGTRCLNCEHPLDISDKYCPDCGQLNSTKKLSFDDFFNEFFSGIFAYDSRLLRTLRALIFNPGKISKDYIHGRRVRYANPFRFYLSASILFFIIWSFSNSFNGIMPGNNAEQTNALSETQKKKLLEDLSTIPKAGNSPVIADTLIIHLPGKSTKSYRDFYISQKELNILNFSNSFTKQLELYGQFYKDTRINQSRQALDSLEHAPNRFNRFLYNKIMDWNIIQNNPEIFKNYFLNKLPFIIFFYLPVFALFIWLLYMRRPFNYMEHLIFVFHVQTTFFVIMAIAYLINYSINADTATGIATLLFLFYLYKAMRKFYRQGRFKTLVKFLILNGIFFILALVGVVISLIASFAIF